jgi:hypothetical protein
MENYAATIYLDVTDVFDDYLKLLKRTPCAKVTPISATSDYYQALGTVRGAVAGFGKAVTLMRQPSIYSYEHESGLLLK